MTPEELAIYHKSVDFWNYIKMCRLAEHNRARKRLDVTERQTKAAKRLVSRHPDFPDAMRKQYPRLANLVVDE